MSAQPRLLESERIHAWLRKSILEVSMPPGAVLAESEVSARFGTSRTPVREALVRLADEGLIDIRPQRGTYVARIRLERLEEALFLREAIEGAVLRKLASSADRARIARHLGELVDLQADAVARRDLEATLDADARFHRALVDACGLPGLWDVVGKSRDLHYRLRALAAPQADNAKTALADHRAILRAIRAGDGDLACRRMAVHLDRNRALAHALAVRHPDYFTQATIR